jgi:hypothetical protein
LISEPIKDVIFELDKEYLQNTFYKIEKIQAA